MRFSQKPQFFGHLAAIFTVFVWGATFIVTKTLLEAFSPVEILFFRFIIGFAALLAFKPSRKELRPRALTDELLFLAAALAGVTLYFLCENVALLYTQATNVGVIVSVAPLFTALFAHVFLPDEKLRPGFFIGFAVALCGIGLILFNGTFVLKLNPLGDFLALLACVCWGGYSVIMRKIAKRGYSSLAATRRVFFYGLLTIAPMLPFAGDVSGWGKIFQPAMLANLLFLGLFASALCYAAWNWSMHVLGAVRASSYIYLIPVITAVLSRIILKETLTIAGIFGIMLTILGLFLSERRNAAKE